ncbi:MAG: transglycosylase domain-containing protein [Thermoleophilaceae bacterium]
MIVSGLSLLALVSTVFGMMMAVASDLPQLENRAEYRRAENSTLLGEPTGKGREPEDLAKLTGNQNRILVKDTDISANMENAVIAIEDRRFYQHEGVDYKGIARALSQDVLRREAVQGGSTITQQFVKNALAAQANRSVFQKLREAALAYHLERKWSKQKVLTQYLNSVYFGNGAYGVEAAARTYFGGSPDTPQSPTGQPTAAVAPSGAAAIGLKDRVARELTPSQAALLAGIIASPSMYDPVENPRTAKKRRDTVLSRMREQKVITEDQYRDALDDALPTEEEVHPPQPESRQPYFTSWLTQQLVDRYKAPAVFSGGLDVQTTLDPELQSAADKAIAGRLSGAGPSASLVAIENRTGKIRAMVGGTNYQSKPFNLATNGHRQPGSSFKPFTLIQALDDGVDPNSTFASQKKSLPIAGGGRFEVNNYEGDYSGVASLASATARSDNSVYAELGLKTGTKKIARLARRMGVRTPVSTNPAMTLGGLKEGLTPLELAYAYSTLANHGMRVSGSLASSPDGPVAIDRVKGAGRDDADKRRAHRVFPAKVGEVAEQMLAGVISGGTGKAAQIGEFAAGKTGTTENYGDAWFVGYNRQLTVAVWVGYPDKLKEMKTEYHGGPVAGGTYPAEIWHDFMTSFIAARDRRDAEAGRDRKPEATPTGPAPSVPRQGQTATPVQPPQSGQPPTPQQPQQPPPRQQPSVPAVPQRQTPAPAPAPAPTPAPGGGGGGAAPGGGTAPGNP